jgi:hypothetical protein
MSLRPLIQTIAEQLAAERRAFVTAPWWRRRKARDDLLVALAYGVQNCLRSQAMQFPAIAMEAGTGATGNTDATAEGGDSAGRKASPNPSPESKA